MKTLGRISSFIGATLLMLATSATTGCMAGNYSVNECNMVGNLTKKACIDQCARGSAAGGICAISYTGLVDSESFEPISEDDATTWSCLLKLTPGQDIIDVMPKANRGWCNDSNVRYFDILPSSAPLPPK